jgi:Zinc finger, C3HC4 type (RING finger)
MEFFDLEKVIALQVAKQNYLLRSTQYDSWDESNVARDFSSCFKDAADCQFSDTVWKCPICFGLPRIPITLRTCGHLYCETCVRKLLVMASSSDAGYRFGVKSCSVCRKPFTGQDILEWDKWACFSQAFWNCLRVKCAAAGCDYVDSPMKLRVHEQNTCPMRTVSCPGASCTFQGSVKNVTAHAETCKHVVMFCKNCKFLVRYVDRANHSCEMAKMFVQDYRSFKAVLQPGKGGAVGNEMEMSTTIDEAIRHIADRCYGHYMVTDADVDAIDNSSVIYDATPASDASHGDAGTPSITNLVNAAWALVGMTSSPSSSTASTTSTPAEVISTSIATTPAPNEVVTTPPETTFQTPPALPQSFMPSLAHVRGRRRDRAGNTPESVPYPVLRPRNIFQ